MNGMRRIWASAAYRLAFTWSAAFALAILLLGTAVYYAADAEFRRQQDVGLADETAGLLREFGEGGMPDLLDAITKRQAINPANGYRYAVFDSAGHQLTGAARHIPPRFGAQDLAASAGPSASAADRALVTPLSGSARLVVAVGSEAVARLDRTILALFSTAFALVLVLGLIGALALGGYLRRRLERIGGTARAIVAGKMDRRVPVSPRRDEFDQLALALNAMLDRIVLLLENLRQVSADLAHDLRTPLARLRGQIETALDGSGSPDAQRPALKRALAQSDDLLALFAAILRIAEVESGTLRHHFAPVDLSALMSDLAESYDPAVSDGGRTLATRIAAGITINGDRELLAQAAINLLDNAQRHTPPGTAISLDLQRQETTVVLTVADTGPGVPEADRSRIVRRFARLDASRSTPGHGLGLHLVSAIIAAHEGSMAIEDNAPGLRARLELPDGAR